MANTVICGIYYIQNQVNKKYYVGQSIDIFYRWGEHTRELNKNEHGNDHLQASWNKYGKENFKFSIIEECKKEELDSRERYWVKHYDSFCNGYNQTEGGQDYRFTSEYVNGEKIISKRSRNYSKFSEQDVLEIISRIQEGDSDNDIANDYDVCKTTIASIRNHRSWKHLTNGVDLGEPSNVTESSRKKRKPVDVYTKKGTFIQSFESINEAARKYGDKHINIQYVCEGKRISAMGYIFRYKGDPFDKYSIRKCKSMCTVVDQYDLDWNYIQSFDSIQEANKFFGTRTSIHLTLDNPNRIAHGYHWLRKGELPPKNKEIKRKRWRAVDQYDKDWNFIKTFSTLSQASKEVGVDDSHISNVVNNYHRMAGGFYWLESGNNPPEQSEKIFKIDQYDLNGNYIRSYKTIAEASKLNNIEYYKIFHVLQKTAHQAGGYCWAYHNDVLNIKKYIKFHAVDQYDKFGNLVGKYNSIKEASECSGVHASGISNVVKGNAKTAGGYFWKYSDVTNKVS